MVDWWLFFASNVLVLTMTFHTYLGYTCQGLKLKEKVMLRKQNLSQFQDCFFFQRPGERSKHAMEAPPGPNEPN